MLAEHDRIVGETVLTELRGVLNRKLRLPDATIDALEAFVRRQAIIVTAEATVAPGRLEGGDAAVLADAAVGAADLLVTGDQDLLKAHHTPVKTVSPRRLWDLIRRAP